MKNLAPVNDGKDIPRKEDINKPATSSSDGLMTAADKKKLDGIAAGATAVKASAVVPKAPGTAAMGTDSGFARGDHVHPKQTDVSGNAGTATKLATARKINGVAFDGSKDITVVDNTKVPLSGGTMAGNLIMKNVYLSDGVNSRDVMSIIDDGDNANYGSNLLLGAAGNIFVGSGESSSVLYNTYMAHTTQNPTLLTGEVWNRTGENAYFSSDNHIFFLTECQSAANRKVFYLNTSGVFAPGADNGGQLGYANSRWKEAYITNIHGALDGNAKTAAALQTARNIGVDGDVTGFVSFNGSGNAVPNVVRRGCVVGQSGNTVTNPYYKFASLSVNTNNFDGHIKFLVTWGWGDTLTKSGILSAHIRSNTNGWAASELVWEYAESGIDISKFRLAHTAAGTNPTVAELWCVVDQTYTQVHFDVLAEGTRTSRNTKLWTLYNTVSAGSAAGCTAGYTVQNSTLGVIKNSIQGNADTVDNVHIAATADGTADNDWIAVYKSTTVLHAIKPANAVVGMAKKLQTARKINGVAFDGSNDITIADNTKLPLAGGNMTGTVNTSKTTGTYLAGNQGQTIINSTAGAGAYTMLAKLNSTNGYFTIGVYKTWLLLNYTAKTTTDAGTNNVTKSVTLLDEAGNSAFPGTVTAPKFKGALTGNADTATKATQDSAGQEINKTYIKTLSINGKIVTYTKGDGTTGTITTQDTNTTYTPATSSKDGLMSAADKAKLDSGYVVKKDNVGYYIEI